MSLLLFLLACFSCFSHVQLFVILWTVAHHGLLPMGFSRQEYWIGLLCPPPEYLPDPGIKPTSPVCPALQMDSLSWAMWEASIAIIQKYSWFFTLILHLPPCLTHLLVLRGFFFFLNRFLGIFSVDHLQIGTVFISYFLICMSLISLLLIALAKTSHVEQ